ncbi:hypothetical protein [Stenotrophomonas sp.]|uniref:hypothetical protein n=1 Tax=Stenotrophomonas sp. TaxID=69392 RepID=UPI0028A10EBF|nr:hypothetical protein [Stenotrophomonas sp.]
MRIVLLSAIAALALSACSEPERTGQGKHADAIEQPAPATRAPERNVPGGGSGTAASEQQDSGSGAGTGTDTAPPPKP